MSEPRRPSPDPMRSPHSRTRSTDWHLRIRENWYRDVWMLVITGFVLVALLDATSSNHIYRTQLERGRHFAIAVSCAVESAVTEAGRAVIAGSGPDGSRRFILNLEALGYRPRSRAAANRAAIAYVHYIDAAVQRQIGLRRTASLIKANGTIDCVRLEQLAKAP